MTVAEGLTIKVWVPEVWDVVTLNADPDWSIGRMKEEALWTATGRRLDPGRYAVKLRGARVLDETVTLADLEAREGTPFIVLPARRRPVR